MVHRPHKQYSRDQLATRPLLHMARTMVNAPTDPQAGLARLQQRIQKIKERKVKLRRARPGVAGSGPRTKHRIVVETPLCHGALKLWREDERVS